MEDPEDQVVTDYCNDLCSSVSGDLKNVLFKILFTLRMCQNSWLAISDDVCQCVNCVIIQLQRHEKSGHHTISSNVLV